MIFFKKKQKKEVLTDEEIQVLQNFITGTEAWYKQMQQIAKITGTQSNMCQMCGINPDAIISVSRSLQKLLENKGFYK